MLTENKFTNELAFLNKIVGDRNVQYRQAEWLQSPFAAEVWKCLFGDGLKYDIDFRIRLDDGELLTNPKHQELLDIFKCWLCVQTHFDATGGQILSPQSAQQRVSRTLHVIDYFLLNSKALNLAEFGLATITENDLRGFFLTLSNSSSVVTSIYEWPVRLGKFLRNKINGLQLTEVEYVTKQFPFLAINFPPTDDQMLQLTQTEIILARTWLWSHDFYKPATSFDYKFGPDTEKLARLVLPNTLRIQTKKPVPEELLIDGIERYSRELPAIQVRTNQEDQLSLKRLNSYISVVRRLGLLAESKQPIPLSALRTLDTKVFYQTLNLKTTGRYRTLPQQVVLKSLRDAIEFSIEYGDDLVDSYLSLVERATTSGQTCLKYSNDFPISDALTAKIRALGVVTWTLDNQTMNFCNRVHLDRFQYFKSLRTNIGLWELLRVFYGAVQVCVGMLMARRIGELSDLFAGRCLDVSNSRLVFYNRKSGIAGMREKESRPIPKIAVKMIQQLEKLQAGLVKMKLLKHESNLFCFPSKYSGSLITDLNHVRLSESFDFFCDYFQTPVNQEGQRYYIRQHQLRRFFAMLFFWGRSFGGMDTLRWFLGHTDIQHLYHYITESTPGEVLRSVKAQYAGEQITNGNVDSKSLSELIEKHFGTRNFSVLDSNELDEYIEELMIEGRVEIEPEFFETPDGQSYRILVKVVAIGCAK